jgi:hypothetical protein
MQSQLSLFAPPAIERAATIPAGIVFRFYGRALRVHRLYGSDARAPVIVEELAEFGSTLKGQFAIWSYDAVSRAVGGKSPCR